MLRKVAAIFAALAISASPAAVLGRQGEEPETWTGFLIGGGSLDGPRAEGETGRPIGPYRGVGAWVDLFDEGPWKRPGALVKRLAQRDVKTIYLQTSSYGQRRAVMHQAVQSKILREAHARDMKVVAWYVPDFVNMKRDLHRSLAAVRFQRKGHTFDSFGIDIEATHVSNISVRNRRLLRLVNAVRKRVADDYAISAITPDPKAIGYWPGFPWKAVAKEFDVIVPMGYFTFQASGYRAVRRYTEHGMRMIKRASGDPDVPIHWIGGISDDTNGPEVRGFVRAAKRHDAIGASLYDAPISGPEDWKALRTFEHSGPDPARKRPPEPKGQKDKDRDRKPPRGNEKDKDDDEGAKGKRDGKKRKEPKSDKPENDKAQKGKQAEGPQGGKKNDASNKRPKPRKSSQGKGPNKRGSGLLERSLGMVP